MNNFCFVLTYLIIFSALMFTTHIAKNNIYINKSYCKYYVYLSNITLILMICDLVRFFCYNCNFENRVFLVKCCSFIIYTLIPFVPYFLCCFIINSVDNSKITSALKIPYLINIFINLLGLKYNLIFISNEAIIFKKGPLYIIEFIIALFYIAVFEVNSVKNNKLSNKKFKYNIYILSLWLLGVTVQMINYKVTVAWLCVSVSIIFYYILFSEKNFRFDTLTDTKNRNAFENDMALLSHKANKAVIVVLDLNGLKHTNDTKGHNYGDEYICQSARVIKVTFHDSGETYRIGGDEFCVICPYKTTKEIENMLKNMQRRINKYNQKLDFDMSIASGYASYNKIRDRKSTPYDVFKKADKNMYERKSQMKKMQNDKERL